MTTEPDGRLDQAALDRINALRSRRSGAPAKGPVATAESGAVPQPVAEAPTRPSGVARARRRPHPALAGRIAATGLGATTMLGLTAAFAVVEATDFGAAGEEPTLAAVPPSSTVVPVASAPLEALPADGSEVEGTDPAAGNVLADLAWINDLPEGAVLTGATNALGQPIVLIVHQPEAPAAPAAPASPASAAAANTAAPVSQAAPAAPAPVAPTPVATQTVVTERVVTVPAPAPAAETRGS